MPEPPEKLRVAINHQAPDAGEYGAEASRILSLQDARNAFEFVRRLPGYQSTPLLRHEALARQCRVGSAWIKHEGRRDPTRSFKVLGPPYALARQIAARCERTNRGREIDLLKLVAGDHKAAVQDLTSCAATSGNHGRALAWASSIFGCACKIFMPDSTGSYRERQIQQFGAETIRVRGNYDQAVDRAVAASHRDGHLLVGDGARSDSMVLRHIVHGYSVVGEELVDTFRHGAAPTHVFIPAGSGSLAAAVTARLWMEFGRRRPKIAIVQPHSADSGYQSCLRGRRTASRGDLTTIMDGLSVGELSPDAWAILAGGAFAFLTIDDQSALAMLRSAHEDRLDIGETGVAALAACRAAATDPVARRQLQLEEDSRVVLVATEGVTDPDVCGALLDNPP